jgi:hypothetical protein
LETGGKKIYSVNTKNFLEDGADQWTCSFKKKNSVKNRADRKAHSLK